MWEDTKETTSDTFNYVFDTTPTARSFHDTASVPIIDLNNRAADILYSNVGNNELTPHSAIFASPFTNQNVPLRKACRRFTTSGTKSSVIRSRLPDVSVVSTILTVWPSD